MIDHERQLCHVGFDREIDRLCKAMLQLSDQWSMIPDSNKYQLSFQSQNGLVSRLNSN